MVRERLVDLADNIAVCVLDPLGVPRRLNRTVDAAGHGSPLSTVPVVVVALLLLDERLLHTWPLLLERERRMGFNRGVRFDAEQARLAAALSADALPAGGIYPATGVASNPGELRVSQAGLDALSFGLDARRSQAAVDPIARDVERHAARQKNGLHLRPQLV